MTVPQTFPAGSTTGVRSYSRTFVEYPESIGTPFDEAAGAFDPWGTSWDGWDGWESDSISGEEPSAFALMKGMIGQLDVPVGSADADVNDNARIYPDLRETLGRMTDNQAFLTEPYDPWAESWEGWDGWEAVWGEAGISAIALLKKCCEAVGV